MKFKLLMAMAVASVCFCSDGYGQGLLNRMMNRCGCDSAPSCCDTPADNCGCNNKLFNVNFSFSMGRLRGCGKCGGFFHRHNHCCNTGCDTGCNTGCDNGCGCRGGLLSRLQFGSRLGSRGCCETPVVDSCNQSCGCGGSGLLSSLRGRMAGMFSRDCCDTGCNTGCNDNCGCRPKLLDRIRAMCPSRGCGCDTGCNTGCNNNDCCRPRLMDRVRGMMSRRGCCDSGCGCDSTQGQPTPADGKKPAVEPKPSGDAKPKPQPSKSDGTLRYRNNPTAPVVDPSAFVSPTSNIIGNN